jgi:hypothetical protein
MKTSNIYAALAFSIAVMPIADIASAQPFNGNLGSGPRQKASNQEPKHISQWSVSGHYKRNSDKHQDQISVGHKQMFSQSGHEPERSSKHDPKRSTVWDDDWNDPKFHDPQKSDSHVTAASLGGHLPPISASHDKTVSKAHQVELTASGHDPISSVNHTVEGSKRHNAEISNTAHMPAKSQQHGSHLSGRHTEVFSQSGHDIWNSVGHNGSTSRRLPPDRWPEHQPDESLTKHVEWLSKTHIEDSSLRHSSLLSQAGHRSYDSYEEGWPNPPLQRRTGP